MAKSPFLRLDLLSKYNPMLLIKQLFILCITLFGVNTVNAQQVSSLKPVLDNYLALKDALVKTDGYSAAEKSVLLLKSITAVEANSLQADENVAWMKVSNDLKVDADHISTSKEISKQREYFMSLSKNMYSVIKVAKSETPVYYQFCPMANKGKGGNWLSLENKVMNPYYGNQMLNCGRVVETIQKQ